MNKVVYIKWLQTRQQVYQWTTDACRRMVSRDPRTRELHEIPFDEQVSIGQAPGAKFRHPPTRSMGYALSKICAPGKVDQKFIKIS